MEFHTSKSIFPIDLTDTRRTNITVKNAGTFYFTAPNAMGNPLIFNDKIVLSLLELKIVYHQAGVVSSPGSPGPMKSTLLVRNMLVKGENYEMLCRNATRAVLDC